MSLARRAASPGAVSSAPGLARHVRSTDSASAECKYLPLWSDGVWRKPPGGEAQMAAHRICGDLLTAAFKIIHAMFARSQKAHLSMLLATSKGHHVQARWSSGSHAACYDACHWSPETPPPRDVRGKKGADWLPGGRRETFLGGGTLFKMFGPVSIGAFGAVGTRRPRIRTASRRKASSKARHTRVREGEKASSTLTPPHPLTRVTPSA